MSRTVTRGLTALALGGLTSLSMISPAHAAEVACPPGTPATYPPGTAHCFDSQVTINATVIVQGKSFTFTFTVADGSFDAGVTITVYVLSDPIQVGTFTSNANGGLSGSVVVPGTLAAGQHHLEFQGVKNGAPVTLTVPFTVSGAGSGLPFTGFELGAASLLGAGLLGAGTLAVVSGRKRKDGLNAA